MKAVVYSAYGPPDELHLTEVKLAVISTATADSQSGINQG